MANSVAGSIRAPQLVGMFGPGSIVNLETLSVMPVSPDNWMFAARIEDPTFATEIGATALLSASSLASRGIDSVIFPQNFVCSFCGAIQRRTSADEDDLKFGFRCAFDGHALYPSRWIVYCYKGHIDDFNYSQFVHAGTACNRQVSLQSRASISETYVSCACGAKRQMGEAYSWGKPKKVRWWSAVAANNRL